jgi:hypothetical protein
MYSAGQAGRIGYVELVPDVDWPEWRPVEGARELLAAVDELWPARCRTYQELATELASPFAMLQDGVILIRREPLRLDPEARRGQIRRVTVQRVFQ